MALRWIFSKQGPLPHNYNFHSKASSLLITLLPQPRHKSTTLLSIYYLALCHDVLLEAL